MENCLELEQAYNRLNESFQEVVHYNEYLCARVDHLDNKLDTKQGEYILLMARYNMLKHRSTLSKLADIEKPERPKNIEIRVGSKMPKREE